MAKRNTRCKKCSEELEKDHRKEELFGYCQLKGKIEREIETLKKVADADESSEATFTEQLELEELEIMNIALEGITTEVDQIVEYSESLPSGKNIAIDQNENSESLWKNDSTLPEGWKSKFDPQNISILSPCQQEFDSILSAYIYAVNNQDKVNDEDTEQLKTKLSDEGWEENGKLPNGWKISKSLGDNLFVILSNDGVLYQTLNAAQEFMEGSDEYDELSLLGIEELCIGLLEEYISKMKITPDTPLKKSKLKQKKETPAAPNKLMSCGQIVTRGTRFPCDQCGKTFRTQSKLSDHGTVHTGFKPYKCALCLKAFSMETNLNTHMVNHKKEVMKLHTCQVCAQPFYYLSKIVQHMEQEHPLFFPYNCNLCDENFALSESLRVHKKNHITKHEVPSCDICYKSFQTKHNLKRHNSMFHPNK